MGRLSRGCRRCRERRVRCDEGRPSCNRCLKRDEVCEGYRDEATIIFRHETLKVIQQARNYQVSYSSSDGSSTSPGSRHRSRSVDGSRSSGRRTSTTTGSLDPTNLTQDEADSFKMMPSFPWLKERPGKSSNEPLEDQAVDRFMDKYVMYPCNQTSTPGFLEHLPSLFKDVNVDGRYALRWAVRAAAYADLSRESDGDQLVQKSLDCYGMALSALGESLAQSGKPPDDYDLMAVVILDIFESLFLPDSTKTGAHAQGMAQILRLRGADQVYSPRGWSLFRLAHHRIQKQQLAFGMPQMDESQGWLDQLSDEVQFVRLEKDAFKIKETCQRAQSLLEHIQQQSLKPSAVVDAARELQSLDEAAVSWRQTSEWAYTTLMVTDVPELAYVMWPVTETVEVHPDVWNAYEWNYHRTARIVFHQQLLKCLVAGLLASDLDDNTAVELEEMIDTSRGVVQALADSILATVPQSFGDINYDGSVHDVSKGPPRCRAIGGYLLLWPIKMIKTPDFATTEEQKLQGQIVFDKIREYTGMKAELGDRSII
ncbi:hypothetical protein BX600DRAFT_444860 [Xylariales sp. PMI_506]|nr:hypothetical protein BX600DRAFT_444860 [Xylariales sp. PMI_506]